MNTKVFVIIALLASLNITATDRTTTELLATYNNREQLDTMFSALAHEDQKTFVNILQAKVTYLSLDKEVDEINRTRLPIDGIDKGSEQDKMMALSEIFCIRDTMRQEFKTIYELSKLFESKNVKTREMFTLYTAMSKDSNDRLIFNQSLLTQLRR